MTDENRTPPEGRPIGDVTIGPDGVTRRGTFRRPDEAEQATDATRESTPGVPAASADAPVGEQTPTRSAPDAPRDESAAAASVPAPVVTEHPVAPADRVEADQPRAADSATGSSTAGISRDQRSEDRDIDPDVQAEDTPPPVAAGSHAGASAPAGGTPDAAPVAPTPAPAQAPVVAPAPPLKEAEKHAPAGTVPVAVAGATGEVPRTIYVEAPTPPKKKGNRGVGILISALATLVFALLWAGVSAAVIAVIVPATEFSRNYSGFITNPAAWIPVITFFIGLVILVAVLNRAGWAWYILGGLLVGALAYIGYLGGALISVAGDISPSEVQGFLTRTALNPLAIAVGLTAREVSIWTGAAIAARGRRVKARNVEARAQFDRESAERRAEYERVRSGFAAS